MLTPQKKIDRWLKVSHPRSPKRQGLGHGLGIFDLFDQRIFSHFLRRRAW